MIKSTIILLTGAGIIGTSSQAVAPQGFEISAGNVTYQMTAEGFEAVASESPQYGVSIVTKNDGRITLRF